jgi:hypothetical protein
MKTKKRVSNFGTAVYLAETYGNDISDEKIIEVAKTVNMKAKTLLKNYKSISKINKFFTEL